MSKDCPKCLTSHTKLGKFCSRKCANSRTFTDASKQLKRDAAQRYWDNASEDERKASTAHMRTVFTRLEVKKTWIDKLLAKPFDELGWDSIRKVVIHEQHGNCNRCGIDSWLGKPITLEIDHINGINSDNRRENLEGLCPNCHSVTDTWRGRNKPKMNGNNNVSDEVLIAALIDEPNIRQALLKVGLAAKGDNYARAKRLLPL